ncbi:MAG: SDR family NAD(P)-dependent oxidoreductase [Acidimicrobiales bacterium]
MRVVVTGAAGFIGSHLCEQLLAGGHEVVGLDCFTDYYARPLKEANLRAAQAQDRFAFHELDLRTDDLDAVLDGADVVVNEAAMPGLVRSWEDFDAYQSCNLTGLQRLVAACQRRGVGRIVQASTSSVYGATAVGTEDQPLRPVSPYGVTKLAAEHLLLAHHAILGLPVVILRYFSIYGPRQRPDMAYRIFCERLLAGEPITVFGDGQQSRGITYVSDCVAATVAALTAGREGDAYNVGGGRELALLDAIEVLAGALGVQPVIERQPARPGDQRRTMADVSKARTELGWAPAVDPQEGLVAEAEWVRAQPR